MGYVAVRGGSKAVENAEKLVEYFRINGESNLLDIEAVKDQFRLGIDKIMSEGSLYDRDLAAAALKQSEGDKIEASFLLRAFRATKPRAYYSTIEKTNEMRILRRISAAFKDVPGGQILGPTRDYTTRLIDYKLFNEDREAVNKLKKEFLKEINNKSESELESRPEFPKVIEILKEEGLLLHNDENKKQAKPDTDITRDGLDFPASRSAALQVMARGETGGMITLAYSTMRGYGNIHPVLGELRVGYLPLKINHPERDEEVVLGEVLVTEAEVISQDFSGNEDEDMPVFTVGYGICFGHNEEKAIAMAVLDRSMAADSSEAPAEDQEFVLSHIDGIEAAGFTSHWKLPHYVTFQSVLDRIRKSQAEGRVKDE
jgi:alpha-D-ribose 1-methylphosphonate 5-triphosphate synthase subunit PhnI